jgi:hypothetical protein
VLKILFTSFECVLKHSSSHFSSVGKLWLYLSTPLKIHILRNCLKMVPKEEDDILHKEASPSAEAATLRITFAFN